MHVFVSLDQRFLIGINGTLVIFRAGKSRNFCCPEFIHIKWCRRLTEYSDFFFHQIVRSLRICNNTRTSVLK